jgi:chorismate-pyruvate lyase
MADTRTGRSGATTQSHGGAASDGDPRRAAELLADALSGSDDTVTALLESLTGEVVEAERIAQTTIVATASNRLDVVAGHALVSRQAILRGRTSRRDYLYAETLFVADRLPDGVRSRLATTTDPIGRVFAARDITMSRTVLGTPHRTPTVPRLGAENALEHAIFARRYRVEAGGLAVMLIDEWFLPSLRDVVLGVT